jgi:hypothetical protein
VLSYEETPDLRRIVDEYGGPAVRLRECHDVTVLVARMLESRERPRVDSEGDGPGGPRGSPGGSLAWCRRGQFPAVDLGSVRGS